MLKSSLKYVIPILLIGSVILVYTETKDTTHLSKFRSTAQPYPKKLTEQGLEKGLAELRISGSGRISQSPLKKALADVKVPIYVLDLQQELHYFINGLPVNWFGYDLKTDKYFVEMGPLKPKPLLRRLLATGKFFPTMNDTQTEKQVIEGLGYHYIGGAQLRGRVPQPQEVDNFIQLINSLPKPSWVHFHCSGGNSRTTMAMIIVDILNNGRELSLEDIVKRHVYLGAPDLFDTTVWTNGTYTKEQLLARKNFIIQFYDYMNDPKGFGILSWQDWVKENDLKKEAA